MTRRGLHDIHSQSDEGFSCRRRGGGGGGDPTAGDEAEGKSEGGGKEAGAEACEMSLGGEAVA
jgi:hypothetical protein